MSLLDLEDPPSHGEDLVGRIARKTSGERSENGQQSYVQLMYSTQLFPIDGYTNTLRSLEILKPKVKKVVGRIPAISSASNAKDVVQIENTVTFAMAPSALPAGEYCTRRSGRLRGLYRTRRQILLSLRRSRQFWRPRQVPLSRTCSTRTMKTRHGLVSYERSLSFPHSATMGGMPA